MENCHRNIDKHVYENMVSKGIRINKCVNCGSVYSEGNNPIFYILLSVLGWVGFGLFTNVIFNTLIAGHIIGLLYIFLITIFYYFVFITDVCEVRG